MFSLLYFDFVTVFVPILHLSCLRSASESEEQIHDRRAGSYVVTE
jgi:hypothetical protein